MAYILKDEIKINKPIIFLCGPYYNDLDKSDRRKILQDFLLELGVMEAFNLDGGGSTALAYQGKLIRSPGRELTTTLQIFTH